MRKTLILMAILTSLLAGTANAEDLFLYAYRNPPDGPVLVPRLKRMRTGGTLLGRVSALFDRLKRDYRRAYGDASLDLSGERSAELVKGKIATVILDPGRRRYWKVVLAECVYTFSALGLKGVRAGPPGSSKKLYTRRKIDIPAFVLTLPLWRGLPPVPYGAALVRLPGDQIVSAGDVARRLKEGDDRLVGSVLSLLKHSSRQRRLRAVRALGYVPRQIAKKNLLPRLQDEDSAIRTAAVDGLSRLTDRGILVALREVLSSDRKERVRAAAARALMQSGDRRAALAGISYVLKSPDPDRKVALLRRLKGDQLEGVTEALMPLLRDPSAAVREAVLGALAGRSEKTLLEAVVRLVQRDASKKVQDAAARLLQQSGENRFVAAGLAHELRTGDRATAAAAARRLGALGGAGRRALEEALVGTRPEAVRKAAVRALAQLGDRRSMPALARAAAGGLVAAERAAEALMAKQSAAEIARLLASREALLRRLAARAAGGAKDPAVQQALASAALDRDLVVRRAVAEALGKVGGSGATVALVSLLQDESDAVRQVAADSLGILGDPRSRRGLLGLAKYGNVRVRRAAFDALSRLRGIPSRSAVTVLLDALYDEDARVREYALLALAKADRKDRRIVSVVRLQLKDSASGVRRAALRALGVLGNRRVVSSVADSLGDGSRKVRREAIRALELLGGTAARDALEQHAKSERDSKLAGEARDAAERMAH